MSRPSDDLGVRVDAHRRVINALGEQTAARFDRLEGRFDQTAAGFARLAELIAAREG